ncbi:YjgF-like protein [Cucurbitaria berberidis CBS 394.84]|uniref:YjgF-like protein n=1 Tax=Cucurbitaria berberidis CBS 394.84 TaxID=1168544 RepID=A0A9P4GI21_9PLEO|nr:YjgF-like protein [Cucurbitaria berberidis CBS 394.84]KAF1846558.1 YjgF-like protein [Cucurbitaria berberidis CBS 394.84]
MASSNKPHAFNPPTVPVPPPTYDQVCITPIVPTSKLITLAGQTGLRQDQTIPSDIKEQARGAYAAVNNCLKAAGATPRDIIHVRHYIVKETGNPDLDRSDVVDRGWGELWIEFMDKEGEGHRPPDTVVGVASLAKKALLYEVEVWALISS